MGVLFFLLLIVSFIIYGIRRSAKQNSKALGFLSQPGFNPTEVYTSNWPKVSISYDKESKQLCILTWGGAAHYYKYQDVLQSELEVDGNIISRKSVSGTIGRSLLGGIIGGGLGAVIGGVTGKSTQSERIGRIDLKVYVNDTKTPFHKINFLNVKTKKGSLVYKGAYNAAEKWHGVLSTIIKQGERTLNEPITNDRNSIDDLVKLKELLDSGALTQEEFDKQKKLVLGHTEIAGGNVFKSIGSDGVRVGR